MQDIQKGISNREIDIDRVGIQDIRHPIEVKQKNGETQKTVSFVSLSVDLPKQFKGTHMSRFIQILQKFKTIDTLFINEMLDEIAKLLSSNHAYMKVVFPYFLSKKAPVSGEVGLMDYDCSLTACRHNGEYESTLTVSVPVSTVCPCSKAISDRGAHNQRGIIDIKTKTRKGGEVLWIEDIIKIAESAASSPVWSVLKRPDEKWVTEQAYDNPVFVEDIVREVSHKLLENEITPFVVKAVNQESIHNHAAYAKVIKGKFDIL